MSAMIPAKAGVDADVPPTPTNIWEVPFPEHEVLGSWKASCWQTTYKLSLFEPILANSETSGISRAPSAGVIPFCHEGLAFTALAPPLPPRIFKVVLSAGLTQVAKDPAVAVAAQESFQVLSGIYPSADVSSGPLLELQNCDCLPASSKSVPPTATLNGVEAAPLTPTPLLATVAVLKSSQPSEPPSPAETIAVIPCAAACSQRDL